MKRPLFLFDIDGTLLWCGGAGSRALELAFAEVFGLDEAMNGVSCDGKTDPLIVREVLDPLGLHSENASRAVLEAYVRHLGSTLNLSSNYRVLPGTQDCLDYLKERFIPCGLATGNLEAGAKAKLSHGGLDHFFSFGGFGSDAEERTEVVRQALARGRAASGDPQAKAVVIGDTPRDIAAAHAVGVLAVGVAAGNFSSDDLHRAAAEMVIPDLSQPQDWVPQVEELLRQQP